MPARILLALLLITARFTFASPLDVPAAIAGRYGPEFTFTYNGTIPDSIPEILLNRLRHHLKVSQPEGAKFKETNRGTYYRFHSPNGWWFEIMKDMGVMEFRMSPMTVAEFKKFKDDIHDAIFVTCANVGLYPWDYLGGGHINIDIDIFGGDIQLAANFLKDTWNHNELSMGVLSYDSNNASPMQLFVDSSINAIKFIIANAERGAYPNTSEGVMQLFKDVNAVQSMAPDKFGRTNRYKNHNVNLSHAGRVELRSVRPQKSVDVWVRQIELLDSRINNHLRHIRHPLPFVNKTPVKLSLVIDKGSGKNNYLNPPVDPQQALRAFHRYVRESRLHWRDHRDYLWPDWIRSGELERFESTEDFKRKERLHEQRLRRHESCAGLLGSRTLSP